jgi:dihydrofolate synthase/folylpolyglutamate synthase
MTTRDPSSAVAAARDLQWLFARTGGGVKLGLERMRALLGRMGQPQDSIPTLVVGGTNGKGSVATICASILEASGKRVGLFTSPHLCDYGERIRVAGRPIAVAEVEEFLGRFGADIEATAATFFEITAALAFQTFRAQKVDVAVMEVGLGGRLDATNVSTPRGTAVTTIGLEHTGILGPHLLDIAREKYAIARPDRPLVVGSVAEDVAAWFRERATRDDVCLTLLDDTWTRRVKAQGPSGLLVDLEGPRALLRDQPLALHGSHQADNAALACALLDQAGLWPGIDAVRRGLAGATIRGRFDVLQREPFPVVFDVAHNAPGIAACVDTWRHVWGERRPAVVFSSLRDKDLEKMVRTLSAVAACAFVPQLETGRARPRAEVVATTIGAGIPTQGCVSVEEALELALESACRGEVGGVLCAGSFHVTGAAYTAWG